MQTTHAAPLLLPWVEYGRCTNELCVCRSLSQWRTDFCAHRDREVLVDTAADGGEDCTAGNDVGMADLSLDARRMLVRLLPSPYLSCTICTAVLQPCFERCLGVDAVPDCPAMKQCCKSAGGEGTRARAAGP
jgi:hypothetical protein